MTEYRTWMERLEDQAALSVACVCGAGPGEPCRDEKDGDFESFIHRSRRLAVASNKVAPSQ